MAATDEFGRFAMWAAPSLLAMTRLARRRAPQADPDDVVQDTLVRAWQEWDRSTRRRVLAAGPAPQQRHRIATGMTVERRDGTLRVELRCEPEHCSA
ncbi:MAG: sigma factor [Jatrophihabitantaceae bacterium]